MTEINTLNDSYKKYCEPNYKSYKKIDSGNIVIIDDFFKNFDHARDFLTTRDKWQCGPYQGNEKPGYETIFPDWIGKSLIQKYILDNKMDNVLDNSYTAMCNFNYHDSTPVFSLSNSNFYPHVDNISNGYICLVNLNSVSITTNFYSYKNIKYCSDPKLLADWDTHTSIMTKKLLKFYKDKKRSLIREDVKRFLDENEDTNIKLVNQIQYNPNQAIIYPAIAFHSANVTENFTKTNPRCVLRILFEVKNASNRTLEYK